MPLQIIAALLDPGENGFDIVDLSIVLGIITVASGLFAGAFRVIVLPALDRRIEAVAEAVVERLDERTKPIQPDANGGASLPDAIADIRTVQRRQGEVIELLTELVTAHRDRGAGGLRARSTDHEETT